MADGPSQDPADPELPRPRLSSRQQDLRDELAVIQADLAGFYQEAVTLLRRVGEPGVARIIAHAARELLRGVIGAQLDSGWQPPERGPLDRKNEDYRKKIGAAIGWDPNSPQVTDWFELYNFFVGVAHYPGPDYPANPSDLALNFDRMERLLYGLIGPYFKAQGELDDILLVQSPGVEDVTLARSYLSRLQARRYFFSRLKSPAWLQPLANSGVFDHPPEITLKADGTWQGAAWPEGSLLIEMADKEPESVAAILLRIPATHKNPGVWMAVLEASLRMPPAVAKRLVPSICEAMSSIAPVLWTNPLTSLIERLASAGEPEAFQLTEEVLMVPHAGDIGDVSPYSSRTDWVFPRLRFTNFPEFVKTGLGTLSRLDQERTIRLLLGKLEQVAAVSRKRKLRLFGSRRRGARDPRDLIGRVMDFLLDLLVLKVRESPESAKAAVGFLDEFTGNVFVRLRYRLIAEAGINLQAELDAFFASTLAVEPGKWGREVARTVRQGFAHASPWARTVFLHSISRGPGTDQIMRTLEWRGVAEPNETDIASVVRTWQRRRIVWFRGDVPKELNDLAGDVGLTGKPTIEEQELAEVGGYTGPVVSRGEPRPNSMEDLGARSPEDIAQLLIEWRPGERSFETGTTRGLEEIVTEMAAADPDRATDVLEVAGDKLPLGFVESILSGLKQHLASEPKRDGP